MMLHSPYAVLSLFDEALMTPCAHCNYSSTLEMFVLVLTDHCCDHILHGSIISHYNIYYFSIHLGNLAILIMVFMGYICVYALYVCVYAIIPDHKCLGFIGIYQFGFNEITHLQVGAASSSA